jgi:hypothetical protein
MSPLIARTGEPELPVIETAESWHRDLLSQMAGATGARPAVITTDLVMRLAELLAFRHSRAIS